MGTLYENIQSLCRNAGVRGGKMCVDLGISKSLMTKLKDNPEKTINAETAQKIADYFGVSVDCVLYGDEKNKSTADNDDGLTNEFIQLFSQLSPEEQLRELAYLRSRASSNN